MTKEAAGDFVNKLHSIYDNPVLGSNLPQNKEAFDQLTEQTTGMDKDWRLQNLFILEKKFADVMNNLDKNVSGFTRLKGSFYELVKKKAPLPYNEQQLAEAFYGSMPGLVESLKTRGMPSSHENRYTPVQMAITALHAHSLGIRQFDVFNAMTDEQKRNFLLHVAHLQKLDYERIAPNAAENFETKGEDTFPPRKWYESCAKYAKDVIDFLSQRATPSTGAV